MIGENTQLEEALSLHKQVVVRSDEVGAAGRFLLEWNEGADFQGVSSQPLGDSGQVKPCYFRRCADIPSESFWVLAHDARGYTFFMVLTHAGNYASLQGDPLGLVLQLAGSAARPSPVLLIIRGENLYQTITAGMARALELTGGNGHLIDDKLPAPKWFGQLGWESGPTLGAQVSHEGVLNAAWSLWQAGAAPGFVLIDEGWQDLQMGALASFKADASRFPDGLRGVVQDLHRIGIKHIGVWHSLMGGRNGIGASLAGKYELPRDPQGRYYLGSDLGRTFQFYHDYYDRLHDQGITFTKVGDQASIGSFCSAVMDITQMMKNLQSAIQAASSIQFDSFHFNADSLGNGNIFYWANSRVAAAAAPLIDQNPLGVMHSIRDNLSNGIWLQSFMQPDFDSWMSDSPHREILALFHALSGSLNIICDRAGSHDKPLLKKMLLPSGRLLQADRILTLCADSVFVDPLESKHVYKAFTSKGECGIIAAFNLCSGRRTLNGFVSSSDIEGLRGETFAVHSHLHGFLGVVGAGGAIPVCLKPDQGDVLTFSPISHGVAVFGCHDFFLAPGVLVDVDIEEDSVHVTMLVAGPLLLYSEKQVLEVRRNGHTVPWEQDGKRKTLSIDADCPIIETHATYTILFES